MAYLGNVLVPGLPHDQDSHASSVKVSSFRTAGALDGGLLVRCSQHDRLLISSLCYAKRWSHCSHRFAGHHSATRKVL